MPIKRIDIDALLPTIRRNATILVPNHRIRDAIICSYANSQTGSVFLTPRVYAIDIWLRDLWELSAHNGLLPFAEWQMLDTAQEHFIWTAIIEQSLATLPLLNPEETASAANESYRNLKQWLPHDPIGRLQQFASAPDVGAFVQWIKSYHRHCEQHRVISLVDAIEKMLGADFSIHKPAPLLPAEICLVNFFEPPPLYQLLFAQLAAVSKLSEMALQISASTTASTTVTSTTTSTETTTATTTVTTTATSPTWHRRTFTDQFAELFACANWARDLAASEPDAHIGIVCTEDLLSQATLHHQLNSVLAGNSGIVTNQPDTLFNSSGSRQQLLDTGIMHDAFLLLGLVNNQQSSNDLSRLLQSPYVLGAELEKEPRLQMELHMRRYFTATCTLTDFSWHLQQAERQTHAPLLASALLQTRSRLRQFPASALAWEWSQHFAGWLEDLGWPGQQLSVTDISLHKQWQDTLRAFAGSSAILGKLSLHMALTRLKTLCKRQPLAAPFQASNPLSIYTVPEAIGLHFDYVWLLGCSDQSWPPSAHPSPFIPYALQREAQIPGSNSDIQLQRAGRQLARLGVAVAQQLIASYHQTDGELAFGPSSFIAHWPEQLPPMAQVSAAILLQGTAPVTQSMETIADLPAFALQARESVRGGQTIISNQSSCPFRAFAKHRLQTEPLARFEAGLSLRDRGSALHAALELLFGPIDSRAALLALTPEARATLVTQAADHAIAYLSRRHPELMTPRFRELEQQRIATLLHRFLDLEKDRMEFQVLAREASMQWQHATLQLQLKIDRIDVLADQSLALIDYKTGKRVASGQSWLEPRPEDMQLPLYYTVATAARQEAISAVAIAHVNAEKIAYSGLVASANLHASLQPVSEDKRIATEWATLATHWQTLVEQRAQEFVDGCAQVAPVRGRLTCEYCGLEALCRIQEQDANEPDEESGQEAEA